MTAHDSLAEEVCSGPAKVTGRHDAALLDQKLSEHFLSEEVQAMAICLNQEPHSLNTFQVEEVQAPA